MRLLIAPILLLLGSPLVAQTFDCGFDYSCINGTCGAVSGGGVYVLGHDSVLIDEALTSDVAEGPSYSATTDLDGWPKQAEFRIGESMQTLIIQSTGEASIMQTTAGSDEPRTLLGACIERVEQG